MKGGKLFQILKSLTPEEFRQLRKVIASPIYNTDETLGELYKQLRGQYPNFDSSKKGKQKLFKKIWPEKEFSNYKIHRLYTQLTQLVEEYLLLLEQRGNGFERKKRLLNIYGKRNLIPFFEKEAREMKKALDDNPFRDLEYYKDRIQLNETIYFHPLNNKYNLQDESLDRLMDSLDYYFVWAKMRYGASLKSRERILAKPGNWRFMEAIDQEQGLDIIKNTASYQLYHKVFLLLQDEGLDHFEAYEKMLFKNITQLNNDGKILFFSGLNFINRQVNKGNFQFSQKALEWYQFGLYNGLLIEDGKLNEVTFGNIVVFGCRQKEYIWTKHFMESYQGRLKESLRKDVTTYHLGLWHFYQKEYKAAFSILLNYTFIPAYFLKSRLTAIRAIFEQFIKSKDYYELLMHQIHAFEMAMKRGKSFSTSAKEPILNCLTMIKSLSRKIWNHKIDEQLKSKYFMELNTPKRIAIKQWLHEKVSEL